MSLALNGLIPATITPFDKYGRLDEAALREYVRWLLGFPGLTALAVNMDTSEGPHLTREERRHILEVYRQEVTDRLPLLAGIPGPSTAAAVEAARDAREAGASGLVIFPTPAFLGEPLPPEVPYQYHAAIARAVSLPLVLFQLQPALGGVIFSRETLLKLIEIDSVVALKEASFDALRFAETARILREAPRPIALLTGNGNFILTSILLGADGALSGFGTIAIAEQVEMIQRVQAGDILGARTIYEGTMRPLAEAIYAPPLRNYRVRLKEALCELGVLPSAVVRPPLLPLSDEERATTRQAVRAADLQLVAVR